MDNIPWMRKPSIIRQVESLRETYIDCRECPPEKNCCKFTEDYLLELSYESAKAMVGESGIENLVQEGKLKRKQITITLSDGTK
jgi:hypothetical protein